MTRLPFPSKGACCAALLGLGVPFSTACADEAAAQRALDTVLFSSLEAGRSGFISAGVKHVFGGSLDRNGFALMAGAGFGGSAERGARFEPAVLRPTAQGYALIGHQWMLGWGAASAFVGPELDAEADSLAVLRGARTRFGLRGQAELWAHPTPNTLATASVIAGSARGHLWGRISGGYAVRPGMFVGPEAAFYARDGYREWRIGAHLTGLTWGRFNLRLSGGFLQANDDRSGAYVGLTGFVRM